LLSVKQFTPENQQFAPEVFLATVRRSIIMVRL